MARTWFISGASRGFGKERSIENPPLRIFFGDGPLTLATRDYESRLAEWRGWEPLSVAAHGARR